jgi:CubicO group peptidase (beta-lactamase class C family)
MRRILLLPLLALLSLPPTALQAQSGSSAVAYQPAPVDLLRANGFDDWVRSVMDEWHVPGVAVGAVKDGEVVLLEGYGYRDVERELPVTPSTLLAIGSNSKSFTVVLMAQLVEEGKLDWNKPVREYLPDFQLHDEYASQNMRVRDLVTHVSGLPRHDGLWYGRTFDREELYHRLRYLEPSTTFRGVWQYQNLMFMTAGYLVEEITGRSWDDLVHERIFEPLGMTRSNTTVTRMEGSGDFAYPYLYNDGELHKVPFRNIDNVGPAGSINSSVEEMLHYVQMHIDDGEYEGTRILSEEGQRLMETPQSVPPQGAIWQYDEEIGPTTYGMALSVSNYRGHRLVQHGGGIDGFISQMSWLPDQRIGVVVLTNMSGEANPVPDLVSMRVFDDLLGLEPIDWNARTRERTEQARERQEERRQRAEAERVEGTSPSHPLTAYAGTYVHPAYGTIEVRVDGSDLRATLDQFEIKLVHFHYDVFEIDGEDRIVPLEGRVTFTTGKDGTVSRIHVPLEPAIDDIVFERRGDM